MKERKTNIRKEAKAKPAASSRVGKAKATTPSPKRKSGR